MCALARMRVVLAAAAQAASVVAVLSICGGGVGGYNGGSRIHVRWLQTLPIS